MKVILSGFMFLVVLSAGKAFAGDCKFNYWEVIPSDISCDVYYLPDFTFTKTSPPPRRSEDWNKFCSYFNIESKYGKQRTGYCYTGEGDRMGPTFRLGNEKWSFTAPEKDQVYFADLNYQGCYENKKVSGIVFGLYGWSKAPKYIERSWPLQNQLASCEH